jgi:hypothetical protein
MFESADLREPQECDMIINHLRKMDHDDMKKFCLNLDNFSNTPGGYIAWKLSEIHERDLLSLIVNLEREIEVNTGIPKKELDTYWANYNKYGFHRCSSNFYNSNAPKEYSLVKKEMRNRPGQLWDVSGFIDGYQYFTKYEMTNYVDNYEDLYSDCDEYDTRSVDDIDDFAGDTSPYIVSW